MSSLRQYKREVAALLRGFLIGFILLIAGLTVWFYVLNERDRGYGGYYDEPSIIFKGDD